MFKTVKHTKVSDEIVQQVKTLISQGRLKPGDRLLPERELVKEFGEPYQLYQRETPVFIPWKWKRKV